MSFLHQTYFHFLRGRNFWISNFFKSFSTMLQEHFSFLKNGPTPASFCLFSFFSNTHFTQKTVGFIGIRTRIVRVEGEHAYHLTTNTSLSAFFYYTILLPRSLSILYIPFIYETHARNLSLYLSFITKLLSLSQYYKHNCDFDGRVIPKANGTVLRRIMLNKAYRLNTAIRAFITWVCRGRFD